MEIGPVIGTIESMAAVTPGVSYVERDGLRFRVGRVFSAKNPGQPSAASKMVAIETADGHSFVMKHGPRPGSIEVHDVRQSETKGMRGGQIRGVPNGSEPFPHIGQIVRGSPVTKIQTVDAAVDSLADAQAKGASHELKGGPLSRAEARLRSVDSTYERVTVVSRGEEGDLLHAEVQPTGLVRARGRFPGDTRVKRSGGPEAAKTILTEAASKWIIDASPSVKWPEQSVRHGTTLTSAMQNQDTKRQILDDLGQKFGEMEASGDSRGIQFGRAAVAHLKDVSFDPGMGALGSIDSFHVDQTRAPQPDLNMGVL